MMFHTKSVAVIDDERNVAYLDRNDSKRKLNLNRFDNDWNDNCRFLAVRHCFISSLTISLEEFCL